MLVPTKTGRGRIVTVADAVMDMLREEKAWQEHNRELAGSVWQNDWNLVFTNEIGGHLCHFTVYKRFKDIVKEIGLPKERFHDLRHPYVKHTTKNIFKRRNPKLLITKVWDFFFYCIIDNTIH